MQIFDKQQITNAHVKMKIQKFLNCFQLDESQFQFFSVNGKEKIALCACENENSKVTHFEW